jgi:hypothetical protein
MLSAQKKQTPRWRQCYRDSGQKGNKAGDATGRCFALADCLFLAGKLKTVDENDSTESKTEAVSGELIQWPDSAAHRPATVSRALSEGARRKKLAHHLPFMNGNSKRLPDVSLANQY